MMIIEIFVALTKQKAVRKALDFWYKKLTDKYSLLEFMGRCTWKKEGSEYIIIYRGKAPKER